MELGVNYFCRRAGVDSAYTSRDRSLDVAEPADLEVGHGVRQVVGGEREERQQRRTYDLRTALDDRPSNTHAYAQYAHCTVCVHTRYDTIPLPPSITPLSFPWLGTFAPMLLWGIDASLRQ